MRHFTTLGRSAGIATLLALSALSTPALAGKNDEAQQAIAEATGKIESADKAGCLERSGCHPGAGARRAAGCKEPAVTRQEGCGDHGGEECQPARRQCHRNRRSPQAGRRA